MSHHHPKDQHYWAQLRIALTAGRWSHPFPAKTPNGTPLPWHELLRKFKKHCRGYVDVAEVASQTQALALLLGANSKDEDLDDKGSNCDPNFEDSASESGGILALGDECLLPEERIEEARIGYEGLKLLKATNYDSLNFALAYYAYALGRPSACLSHLGHTPDLEVIQKHISTPTSTTRSTTTTTSLQVPGSGTATSASSWTGSFVSTDVSQTIFEIKDGRAWAVTEAFRSICLQGMSHEILSPTNPTIALAVYAAALPLLSNVTSMIPPNAAASTSGKLDFTSFSTFRELWRWVERLLSRTIILSARLSSTTTEIETRSEKQTLLWTTLKHHSECSKYWPPTFRTRHRLTILNIHLRAYICHTSPPSSTFSSTHIKPPAWLHQARSVVNEYRSILNISTKFPKAGERNVQVEEFVDLCVAVWEAAGSVGEAAGWVIDILWWATRLTFNSHRILRHMSRLFYASGDPSLATRTLHLYVQVVSKAFEAGSLCIDPINSRTDDVKWVETLIEGARMLCRIASTKTGLDGREEAREAGIMIRKAKETVRGSEEGGSPNGEVGESSDKETRAKVLLAEGIWNATMAIKEQDPRTRPAFFTQSLLLLNRSISIHPTPSGYYHLACALARPGSERDLEEAIVCAGKAVEGGPGEIRYWHLLGLLLASVERWDAAKGALEAGAAMGDCEEDADRAIGEEIDRTALRAESLPNGHRDNSEKRKSTFSTKSDPRPPRAPTPLLDLGAINIPPATTLLRPLPDHPPPSTLDVFEQALQLRMTQVAVAEYVEGPEGAGDKWVEVFGWIAERKGLVADRSRMSTSNSRLSVNLKSRSHSALALPGLSEKDTEEHLSSSHGYNHEVKPSSPPNGNKVHSSTPKVFAKIRRGSVDQSTSEKGSNGFQQGYRPRPTRSFSSGGESSKGKKMQRMLKNRVHKGHATITIISKKIGQGVGRNGQLRRTTSAPDLNALLRHSGYQASSIHSRIHQPFHHETHSPRNVSPPPPPLIPPEQNSKSSSRTARENRLLSDLWLMSAATFRRLGQIEQAKGAIQEAEVKDEGNPAVWVQLGLYYTALNQDKHAIDAFHKALFIAPDDVAASVHLCRTYLTPSSPSNSKLAADVDPDNIDLAAGILSHLTRGAGWDVPEAWYFLAKAYGLQGRKDRERECLDFALVLSEGRAIRDIGSAVGWCV